MLVIMTATVIFDLMGNFDGSKHTNHMNQGVRGVGQRYIILILSFYLQHLPLPTIVLLLLLVKSTDDVNNNKVDNCQ